MTRDDILRMAREAWGDSDPSVDSPAWRDNMAQFAAMIIEAKVAEYQDLLDLQQRSYEREIQIEVEAEREAIIQAIPGGHYVDPQWVCDMIRARSKE